jgi:hypothetical protein
MPGVIHSTIEVQWLSSTNAVLGSFTTEETGATGTSFTKTIPAGQRQEGASVVRADRQLECEQLRDRRLLTFGRIGAQRGST